MAIVTALLAPIHLFSFSALLGSQLYQTFIVTKVTFQRLPRAPFINLQKYLFPIYFQSQTVLLFLSAATLPPTRKLMLYRAEQGIANAKMASPEDSGPVMQILKKRFGTAHAMSIHLNLIGLGAHLWYTWRLASRLDTSL
ncbi:hypothetical protein FGSG_05059 [Fusarium graminearum PH-1]|uniref:TMEM205-like domain-containing protein n=1 Tax=Gibberella zeae (strain ATCC MYA-4620 / CBS 123657 / FGSC 9075 / NRRL 31084 / PH-1) TaxID=229533 RepID=I1RM76_GIBZE|nr:hypothetical protein FGSG_05059 [Fusarium graminearum PH-1]ESU10967.1 hypothetical protein FGSG_05059 [Fusarium graminearum PH-1]EYB31810.1 hypothetical protein FG05_05059 [Fusarium graminearum]|eukprot:XP_011323543.1 hypothetical protein FGSG_05059 [Fusarium graminearum PH-1]